MALMLFKRHRRDCKPGIHKNLHSREFESTRTGGSRISLLTPPTRSVGSRFSDRRGVFQQSDDFQETPFNFSSFRESKAEFVRETL